MSSDRWPELVARHFAASVDLPRVLSRDSLLIRANTPIFFPRYAPLPREVGVSKVGNRGRLQQNRWRRSPIHPSECGVLQQLRICGVVLHRPIPILLRVDGIGGWQGLIQKGDAGLSSLVCESKCDPRPFDFRRRTTHTAGGGGRGGRGGGRRSFPRGGGPTSDNPSTVSSSRSLITPETPYVVKPDEKVVTFESRPKVSNISTGIGMTLRLAAQCLGQGPGPHPARAK